MILRQGMIYAKDLSRMTAFYRDILGLKVIEETRIDGYLEFEAGAARFALHAIPAQIAEHVETSSPPRARENNPVKLSFEVEDPASERERLEALGVTVLQRAWGTYDAIDPEGNVFGICSAAKGEGREQATEVIPTDRDAARPFVPAKDFETSRAFYEALGFTKLLDGDVAIFGVGASAFILQRFYQEEFAGNFMMQLMVDDLDAWWAHIEALDLPGRFGVTAPKAPAMQPWGLRVAYVFDPSGVLWHVAQRRADNPAD